MSQLGLNPIYGKIKNVPNHQPVKVYMNSDTNYHSYVNDDHPCHMDSHMFNVIYVNIDNYI
jgi:hypothetical protein